MALIRAELAKLTTTRLWWVMLAVSAAYMLLQLGLTMFGIGTLAATFADSPSQVIACRAFMGMGAAFVMPGTLSILATVFPPAERPNSSSCDRRATRSVGAARRTAVPGTGGGSPPYVIPSITTLRTSGRIESGCRRGSALRWR